MITDEGRIYLKGYQAGINPQFVTDVAFGIGETTPTADDTGLDFEVERQRVSLVSLDYANSRIIIKGPLGPEIIGTVYEVGVFASVSTGTDIESRVITTINSETESWLTNGTTPVFSTGTSRLGVDSLQHTPGASTSSLSNLSVESMDLGDYAATDLFTVAYNVANANTNDIQIRFSTDNANYYTKSLGVQTAGYKVAEMSKGSFTAVGSPSWANLTSVSLITVSKSSGASDVTFDGIRLEHYNPTNKSSILIAREVLDTPFTRDGGKNQEVEFSLGLV